MKQKRVYIIGIKCIDAQLKNFVSKMLCGEVNKGSKFVRCVGRIFSFKIRVYCLFKTKNDDYLDC